MLRIASGSLTTLILLTPMAALAGSATVLYSDEVVAVERTLEDPNDLWVTPSDLTRVNGFVLKPEGACLDDLCVPVMQDRDSEMLVTRQDEKWFNVTQLARRLEQPYAFNPQAAVWSFGALPHTRSSYLESAMAPDFELTDRQGKTVRLKDFRGKKVFLFTWASW